MGRTVKLWCQWKHCQEPAGEEPTVIACKDIGDLTNEIWFCDWHRQEFEIYIPKWRQLKILRAGLKSPHLPPNPPPVIGMEDVKEMETVEVINLGKETIEIKPLKPEDDDDDIPF